MGGSVTTEKLSISSLTLFLASRSFIEMEKKVLANAILFWRSTSRSSRQYCSLRSAVVWSPMVPPGPSARAIHLGILAMLSACRRCWLSKPRLLSRAMTAVASAKCGFSRRMRRMWSMSSWCVFLTSADAMDGQERV